jgi:hypothetical protein
LGGTSSRNDSYNNSIEYSIYRDTKIEELQYNIISFDNIGKALLTVFQCLTLEGWVDIMNNYQDSYDKYIAASYFIALVLLCALLLINLIIAVLLDKLHESQENDSKNGKFLDLLESLVNLGYPNSVAQFMTSYELNITSSRSHKPFHKLLAQRLCSLLHSPKVSLPASSYFSNPIVKFLFIAVNHPLFHLFIFISIMLNTVTL